MKGVSSIIILAIDNGVTGSIAVLDREGNVKLFEPTPTKKEQSYTKTKQNITRIDVNKLKKLLTLDEPCKCWIERPLVNPGRFKATISAMRALEATLIVLEELQIPFSFVDSKQWQRVLLPSGLEKGQTKKAAVDIARRMFPKIVTKDADALLIAEYARRLEIK